MSKAASKGVSPAVETRLAQLHALQRRVVTVLTLASLIPLGFISFGAWVVFGRIISAKSMDQLQTIVRDHAATVDLFLDERLLALGLIARSASREEIVHPGELRRVFANLNRGYTNSYLDLGVIDSAGSHLAYVGPYDLIGKNYAGAPWFEHVSREGEYISDVFLGIRNAPHFIMAVRQDDLEGGSWILRATINSEVFSTLVAKGRLGRTGDCFLLDRQGRYQTPPLAGAGVLDASGVPPPEYFEGTRTMPAETADGRRLLRTMKWIKHGQWLLVAQQEEAEILAPFREAMLKGMGVFAAGVVVIVLAAFFTTRYLFRLIENALEQKERLTTQLLQASKLASLGEMAAGLAHEINNPLAIIATEQTNLSDLVGLAGPQVPECTEMLESVAMTKKQVMRCREITQKMLQFGRQQVSVGAVVDPGPQLTEIIHLLKPQSKVNNVELCLELEPGLPRIHIDPTELQQLAVNIINNAVSAVAGERERRVAGAVAVSGFRESGRFHLVIEDTGPGVPEEIRERIFEPFFTTKAVGKGTGLGLSVCYGIVTKWRGKIRVESRPGAGAAFFIEFPAADDRAPQERA